ncbi:hypothetical protein PF005_g30186 [Phytophthora fragariae]|uniref:RxLR effector protein n=1 Tax=Phytophthora fragariae TaxID=53985 RepID=A0A6A3PWF1_9STRA|nr:hypothetical protein PF003_g15658 [Phytophthora fragariae]KAE8919327.1 hypothetical protein PF009_g30365 [Phytophthora fragariae]KAE8963085.1 hypothetical protein PF011_g29163 [Phytophthora fragariae]KAE9064406.1 hypothetical protein PF007_g29210 [Phytophthora fragariae]KAE9068595.1 hypothetical protein PF006_g29755 [Phytophthora fragariae]
MRVFLILLLGLITLLTSVSGSATNLQTTQNLIQSADAVKPESTHGRLLLRTAAKPVDDEEERGIMDVVTKLGTSTRKSPKNIYHKLYVQMKSAAIDIDKTANAFMKKSFNPDKVYKWLKLGDGNNGQERQVFDRYKKLYQAKHPNWKGKFS